MYVCTSAKLLLLVEMGSSRVYVCFRICVWRVVVCVLTTYGVRTLADKSWSRRYFVEGSVQVES